MPQSCSRHPLGSKRVSEKSIHRPWTGDSKGTTGAGPEPLDLALSLFQHRPKPLIHIYLLTKATSPPKLDATQLHRITDALASVEGQLVELPRKKVGKTIYPQYYRVRLTPYLARPSYKWSAQTSKATKYPDGRQNERDAEAGAGFLQ